MSLFSEFLTRLGLNAHNSNSDTPDLVILEERVLYNAAPLPLENVEQAPDVDLEEGVEIASFADQIDQGFNEITVALDSFYDDIFETQPAESTTYELVVVDTGVEDYQQLVDDILRSADPQRQFEIVLLDANSNGVEQLTSILSSRRAIDALHLVSHGSDGNLLLGNSSLNSETLDSYSDQIAEWKYSLSRDADIFFYGCEVAKTEVGEEFLEELSQLTETDVAASNDITGNSRQGGDWEFEFQVGAIQATAAFSVEVQFNWSGTLFQYEGRSENGVAQSLAVDGADNQYVAVTANNDSTNGDDVVLSAVNASGNLIISPIVVNTTLAGDQKWATVAVSNTADRLVVVWTSDDLGGNLGVYAALYDTSGTLIQSEFRVDAAGSNGNDASVAMSDDGTFVIAWEGSGAADADGIYARRYDSDGTALDANPFSVNDGISTAGLQSNADVSINSSNQFIIAWDDYQDDDTENEIYYRTYNGAGVAQFNGSTGQTVGQVYYDPSVSIASDGSFVVAYTSDSTSSVKSGGGAAAVTANALSTGVTGKSYNSAGVLQHTHSISDTVNGVQQDVTALIFDDRTVAFSWYGEGAAGTGTYGISFDSGGSKVGSESRLDSSFAYNGATDTSSPERGASELDPNAPGYVIWEELTSGVIAKKSTGGFIAGFTGAGYNSGQLVEGYHLTTGHSIGDQAPTIDPTPANVNLNRLAPNSSVVYDVDATDREGTTLVYSIVSGDTDGVFSIDANGVITVVDATDLNANPTYNLVVAVTDNNGAGLSVAKTVNVTLVDLVSDNVNRNIVEDSTYRFTGSDFSDNTGDTVTRVEITTVPANGKLFLNGNVVTNGQVIDYSDITASRLTYVPLANDANNDSLTFRIGDDASLSATAATLTFTVAPNADLNPVVLGDHLYSLDGATVVNGTINGSQAQSHVAALTGGGYVVVWQNTDNYLADGDEGKAIYHQRYDANGNKVGSETRVDTDLTGDQEAPHVIGLADGGYLVTWAQDVSGQLDIYGQRFDQSGNEVGIDGTGGGANSEFLVSQNQISSQSGPKAAQLSDGGFVITSWGVLDGTADSDTGVVARIYDAQGNTSNEFLVNDTLPGAQRDVAVISLANNRFVIGWVDQGVNSFDVKAKVFDAGDPTSGTEFTINTHTPNRQNGLDLAALPNGNFVAIWQADGAQDGAGRGVFGQMFDSTGATVGSEFQINQTTNNHQWNGSVLSLADGGFLVVYESLASDSDGAGVFGRRFAADGSAAGDEFIVNGNHYGDQSEPTATLLSDGRVVVTWSSADGDNLGTDFSSGVYVDRFEFATTGGEDESIAIGVSSLLQDSDGSETIQSITIRDIPSGAIVSDGTGNTTIVGDTFVDVKDWNLSAITILPGSNQHDDFTLRIEVVTQETSNADTETSVQNLRVVVEPRADAISKGDLAKITDEDTVLDIGANELTAGVTVGDTETITVAPGTQFNGSTFPPTTLGPNLLWDNVGNTANISFDSGVSTTTNSGSSIADFDNAFVLDGSGGGEVSDALLGSLFDDAGAIELWIQPDSLTGQRVLFEWGDDTQGIALYQDGDKVLLRIHSPASINGFTTEPYTLVAEGLQVGEFNQIYFMISAGATTTLGDTGTTPDAQLYLNGQLADELVDIPGYTSTIDFASFDVAAGLGKRVGNAAGDDLGATNFEGKIARFEVYDDLTSSDEVELRYWNLRSVPKTVEVAGQSYTVGSTIVLPSTALLHINQDGSLSYDPNGAFETLNNGQSGADNFSYRIQNGIGQSDTVTVNIQVDGVDAVDPVDLSNGIEINADGNDGYFLAEKGNVLGGANQLTVEVMFASNGNNDAPLISYQTTDQPNGAVYFDDFSIVYSSAGTLEVFLPGNAGTASIGPLSGIDYSTIMDGGLHNLGFSWNSTSGDWAVYVDGTVTDQGTGVAVGQSLATGGELVFGQEQDSPDGDFDSATVFRGTFHDIRIWDHVRTAGQVKESYSHKFLSSTPPTGLLANWQFTELQGASDRVADIIDASNSLVLNHASGIGFSASTATEGLQINENSANGTQVGFVVPTDVDGASKHTFNMLDTAGGRFTVDTNTGEITVANTALLNFEDNTSHNVTIEVTDSDGGTYQETFSISVLDVNEQAVVATNTGVDVTVGVSGTVITSSMLNEGDPDAPDSGSEITYTLTSVPTQGQLRNGATVLGLGSTFTQADIDASNIRYDHTDATDTDDSFDFTIEDGLEDGVTSSSGTFNFRITHDNLPTSASKTVNLNEDTSYTVVEADFAFSDLDGEAFDGIRVASVPVAGQLLLDGVLVADNEIVSIADIRANKLVFVPAANEYGTGYASFEFKVQSSNGAFQAGTNVITFDVANDGIDLVVVDDAYVIDENLVLNEPAVSGTLQNDDADGGTFKVIDHSKPTNGTVVVNADGSFTYTPNNRYHGPDSFEYVVTAGTDGLVDYWGLAGDAVDSVGANDGTVNGATTIDGDFGDALSFDGVDDFVQLPDVGYTDEFTLSFKFRVNDNSGTGNQFIYSHGAAASQNSLNIYIGDDAALANRNQFVTALVDSDDLTAKSGDLMFDARPFIDGNWHTYTLTLSNTGGATVYIDGVQMAQSNHGNTGTLNPTGNLILGHRSDAPANSFYGGDLDTLQLFDRSLDPGEVTGLHNEPTLKATVNITVNSVNVNPVVYDNVYGVEFGGSETFQIDRGLLYNATDADGDPLTISIETGPVHGTLSLGLDGTFTYTHNGLSNSADSFTYKVIDGEGGEATATVQINIDEKGLVEGNEFVVNQGTTEHPFSTVQDVDQTNRHGNSSVAVNQNGDYVVVWRSVDQSGNSDLLMRMYDFSGRALSDQIEVSQAIGEDHFGGSVAMDAAGNFVVVWTAQSGSSELDIFARRYDVHGNALGNEFRVTDDFSASMADDFDFGNQQNPSIAMNSSGEFVIVWDGARSLSGGGTVDHDIYFRKFAADGTAEDIVVVNTAGAGDEFSPSVVLEDSGDAFVAWTDTDGIHARVVQADGTLLTEIQSPTRVDILDARNASVASNGAGLIAIAYQVELDDGGGGSHWDTFLQIIDPTNVQWQTDPLGNQTQRQDQISADVAFNEDGSLILTWNGQNTTDAVDKNDVFARRFRVEYDAGNPYAQAISDEFLVSQSAGTQYGASVAAIDSENFVVVWTGEDTSGGKGIFARQYGNQSTYNLQGSVLEDVNGDAQLGDAVGASGTTVKIYREDTTTGISAGDRLIAEVTTDATGAYTFNGLHGAEKYYVVVDSKTVTSSASLNTGYQVDDVWAEQTYGDGGAKFGGLNGSVSDDASSLLTSEHVSEVTFSRANVSSIDFGFSFNVVTNSLGGDNQDDDAAINDRSVQGSLRQFIVNANALDGDNAMRFVPVTSADRVDSGDQTWEILVSTALPNLSDGGTTIDGRAYATDGVTRNNASSAIHGYSGSVGVGVDGVEGTGDEKALVGLDSPELEISDAAGVANGLYITGERVEVGYIAIHGFGTGSDDGNIAVVGSGATNVHIHHNMIGARAHEFVAPNTATGQSNNIFVQNSDDGVIESNLIGFGGYSGIRIVGESDLSDGATGWQIRSNEIRSNGSVAAWLDGIDLNYDTRGTQIQSNLIVGNVGYGIDSWESLGEISISENQITGNGLSGGDLGGVRLFGQDNVVQYNQIMSNAGSGVHVIGNNSSGITHTASTENLISQNAIYGNAVLGIDLSGDSASATVFGQGDGHSLNGVANDANAGNLGFDYPELTGALLDSGRLYISFEATSAFEKIEVYISNNADLTNSGGQEFGQGAVYLGTFLATDLRFNARTGAYFGSLMEPAGGWPAGLVNGAKLTSVAIDRDNNTSEFGTTAEVNVGVPAPTAVDSQVTATEDVDYIFAVNDFQFTDISDSEYQSIRIETLPVNGTLLLNNVAVSVNDTIFATDIQNGNLKFVPAANANGVGYDSFDFSVNDGTHHSGNQATMTIDVTAVNDEPVVNAPHRYDVTENQTSVGFINGFDEEGDSLYYTISGGNDASKFDIDNNTGELTFKTAPDYENPDDWGADRSYDLVVHLNDGNGGLTDQAIQVNVLPENDNDPQLANDQIFILEGTDDIKVDLVDHDLPGDTITVTLIGGADVGLFTFDPVTQILTFNQTPDHENPLDADGNNQYEVRFRMDDNRGRTTEETLVIHVRDVAEVPIVNDDAYVLSEGGSLNAGTVLSNDTYSNNVQVSLVQGPGYGNLTLNTDGTFTYVHGGAEVHWTQFVYEVTDDSNLVNTGTVTLTINPVDDAPVANNDSIVAVGDLPVDITSEVLSNDFDVDSPIDQIVIVSQPSDGTVFIDANGKLIFVPVAEFDGQTSFEYQVQSVGQTSATAVAVIDVTPPPATSPTDNDDTSESTTDPENENPETEITEPDPEVGTTPDGDQETESEDLLVGNNFVRNSGNSDSLADIRNAGPIRFEIEEINLDSNRSLSFATYVYASDVESLDSELGNRLVGNRLALSQFSGEALTANFLKELNAAQNQFYTQFDITMPSLAMAGTSFLTVGYLAWMVRGGILLTTFMSSLPAWRLLDPLAVLESAALDDGAHDDQSIGQLVDR